MTNLKIAFLCNLPDGTHSKIKTKKTKMKKLTSEMKFNKNNSGNKYSHSKHIYNNHKRVFYSYENSCLFVILNEYDLITFCCIIQQQKKCKKM